MTPCILEGFCFVILHNFSFQAVVQCTAVKSAVKTSLLTEGHTQSASSSNDCQASLYKAIRLKRLPDCTFLIDRGACLTKTFHLGNLPAILAVHCHFTEFIRTFCPRSRDFWSLENQHGENGLIAAVRCSMMDIVHLCIELKVPTSTTQLNALNEAFKAKDLKCAKILLDTGMPSKSILIHWYLLPPSMLNVARAVGSLPDLPLCNGDDLNLLSLSKQAVRRRLAFCGNHTNLLCQVRQLPLPRRLKNFLLLDIDTDWV